MLPLASLQKLFVGSLLVKLIDRGDEETLPFTNSTSKASDGTSCP
jgi:hypothetical protein